MFFSYPAYKLDIVERRLCAIPTAVEALLPALSYSFCASAAGLCLKQAVARSLLSVEDDTLPLNYY
jgi:hypothetical protein